MHFLSMWLSGIIAIINNNDERCLSGFSPKLKFFLQLSTLFSSFSWLSWWILWLCRMYSIFLDNLLSSFVGLYHWPLCSQSMARSYIFASLCSPGECVDWCTVDHLFLLFSCGMHSVLRETARGLLTSYIYPP